MAITSQKLLPGSTFSNTSSDTDNIKSPKKTDTGLNIYKKAVKIDKLLKDSFLLKSKEENRKRRELENKKREGKEKELESPKKFKGFEILKNALPRTGFFDSIKRFILFTFAGWLFTNLFKFLPKLLEFVKIISPVLSWFEKGIGLLLEGIVSFIDLGYKAYDTVRSFAKTIGGEGLLEKFDALSGALNTFLNLALIAGMSAASLGGRGRKGGLGGGAKPKPGTGGRPRVTTSGGAGAGRPDIRNPLRQRPTVTGGSGSGIRNPLRKRPTVTTSGGRAVGKGLGKGAGKIGSKIPFVGPLIDFGIRRLIFKEPLGKAAAGAVGAGAGQALGGWLGGSLGGIVGSVVPIAGTLLGAGAGSLIGSIAGGFIGDWIGTSLYDLIEANNDIKTKKMSSGGKVSSSSTIKGKKRNKSKLKKQPPGKIQLGKDVGGEKEIEKIYPNPNKKFLGLFSIGDEFNWNDLLFGGGKDKKFKKRESKKIPNAIKTLLGVADSLGESGDWIGALMRAGVEVALGTMPDTKSLAETISSVLKNVTDPAIKEIKSLSKELFGFAEGGEVSTLSSSLLSSSDTLTLERSIEKNLRTKFDDALKVVRKETRKKGPSTFKEEEKPRPTGRDEMIQENIMRGKLGGGKLTAGQWGPLLDLISSVESAGGSYDSRYGGIYPGYSKLTIAQADDVQRSNYKKWGSAASGKYQFMNIAGQAAYAGLKPTDLFSPENQDKMAIALIEKKRYGRDWMSGKISDPEFAKYLAMEWAGLPRGKDNLSYYHGDGRNKAHTTFDKVLATLSKVKKGGYSPIELQPPKDQKIDKQDNVPMRKAGAGWKPPKPGLFNAIQYLTGDKSHSNYELKGHGLTSNYHDHIAFSTIADKEKAKKALRSAGIKIGSEYRPGDPGYHGLNLAIDVPGFQWGGSGAIGQKEFAGSKKVRDVLGLQGGGLVSPSKPNMPIPDSFASYNDPRKSSTLAIQPIIIEKDNPIPVNSPMYFPSSGSSGVNNSMLPSLMQG